METKKLRIALTQGDTNGVGYEVIFKALSESAMLELCTPIIYGSATVAEAHKQALGIDLTWHTIARADEAKEGCINLIDCCDKTIEVVHGLATKASGAAALSALERATDDAIDGQVDALVTAPLNKAVIAEGGIPFVGHTEWLAERITTRTGVAQTPLMVLMNEVMRVALVTTHLPLTAVPSAITIDAIVAKAKVLNEALKTDFGITQPRIAVLGLNPHAGDTGLLGEEEIHIIAPAVKALVAEGVQCYGPYAADGFFGVGHYAQFDAVLAMYHDQGLAPFKALGMGGGVNYTGGLSLVRTSPDHGTAPDIAGHGVADENSLRQAIYTAIDVWRTRQFMTEARHNPLPKLYKERREYERH